MLKRTLGVEPRNSFFFGGGGGEAGLLKHGLNSGSFHV